MYLPLPKGKGRLLEAEAEECKFWSNLGYVSEFKVILEYLARP